VSGLLLTTAAAIATALEGRREGRHWRCRCPIHGGRSLLVRDGDAGRILVFCHGGCEAGEVLVELRRSGVLDNDWEAKFCRVAESHPKVIAYTKNHNLGLEVPYLYGSEIRKYLPDFIVLVEDGHGPDDPLHLVVEIKGYRREDAKEKKSTMDTYWVPGVNHLGTYGRWAFAEFTEIYQIESDFKAKVESEFNKMTASSTAQLATGSN
jgi:hypothetical protein